MEKGEMTEITPEQLAKLPAWARSHIANLQRERIDAVRALNDYCDDQTESPFRYWDFLSLGDGKNKEPTHRTKYIQTHKMEVVHGDVLLRILIREDQPEIDLQWTADKGLTTDLALIPKSFCGAVIKTKENMR